MEYIQFIQTGKTKRKHGYTIHTNSSEVTAFLGRTTHFPTRVDGTKQGSIVAVVKTKYGDTDAHLGDYITKNKDGSFSVFKPEDFNPNRK